MADPSSDPQDGDYLETLESCDLIALLRLNNGSPAAAHGRNRPQYTACGSNSMKRRSPSPSDPDASAATFSEPKPKKVFVDPKISLPALIGPLSQSHPVLRRCGSDPTKNPIAPSPDRNFDPEPQGHFVEQEECNLSGFSKISLPTSYPVLRRSVSDLTQTNPPPAVPPFSPEKMGIGPETPSPKKGGGGGSASALPPLPPSLRRTVSDLSASRTPPKGPSCLHTAADLMEEESSDSMRLRRMKGRLAEMGQWCNEVVREEEDVNAGSEDDNNNTIQNVSEADPEELVSVERVGECFTIQFKCPCGKGYQILISGNSCYYKLM